METIEHIKLWLEETPDHTCFRVNKLRNFDENELKRILTAQSYELKSTQLPHYYFLKPDCLIIDRWPDNIIVNSGSHEVIVDPSCGAAVLRGSNVFAPGVMGLASDCKLDEVVKIFSDIDGKCKRGLKIEYTGRKQYVGCGYLKKLRCSLFDDGIQPRQWHRCPNIISRFQASCFE
ncbi:unnamed protein product [Leptosia nina]|uniref:PUA domain-containing protein n=1 Tax=Leptosia nina TaxID=320188 RepID=A0AAV1JQU7_9NEOP